MLNRYYEVLPLLVEPLQIKSVKPKHPAGSKISSFSQLTIERFDPGYWRGDCLVQEGVPSARLELLAEGSA
jgi:hypothetical protein